MADVNNDFIKDVSEDESPASGKKRTKVIVLSALAFVCLIIFIVLIANMDGIHEDSSAFKLVKNALTYSERGGAAVFTDSKGAEAVMDTTGTVMYGMDGTKAGFLGQNKDLYIIYGAKKKKIAENVDSFKYAENGASIAYFTGHDEETGEAVLTLYVMRTDKTYQFVDKVRFQKGEDICLSPDGNTIAYMKLNTEGENAGFYSGYTYMAGGAEEEVGRNKLCLEISNVASIIYYAEIDDVKSFNKKGIYVMKGDTDIKLADLAGETGNMYLNKNHTQLIYSYGGGTYMCDNGAAPEKILDYPVSGIIAPENAQKRDLLFTVFNISSFDYKYLISDSELYYIGDYFVEKAVWPVYSPVQMESVFMAKDGKSVLFRDSEDDSCYIGRKNEASEISEAEMLEFMGDNAN